MKLMFIGAAREVTGSCHYLEAAGLKKSLWTAVWSRGLINL